MTTMMHEDEQLSALMDGETSRFETRRTMDRLLNEPSLTARWERYHLIGDMLRRDTLQLASKAFNTQVMTRITSEQASGLSVSGLRLRWTRPLLGFAMTASVAGALVVGLQFMLGPGVIGNDLMQSVQPGQHYQRLAKAEGHENGQGGKKQPSNVTRMNSYFLSHVEQTGGQGVMPYVRMVSYKPNP